MEKVKFRVIWAIFVIVIALLNIMAVVFIAASYTSDINTNIKTEYKANEVACMCISAYNVSGFEWQRMIDNDGKDVIVFDGAEDETNNTKTLSPTEEIKLDDVNNYIVFEYIFTNLSSAYKLNISLDLSQMQVTNLSTRYKVSNAKIVDFSQINEVDLPIYAVDASSKVYVYMLLAVEKFADNALFSGNFVWALYKGEAIE